MKNFNVVLVHVDSLRERRVKIQASSWLQAGQIARNGMTEPGKWRIASVRAVPDVDLDRPAQVWSDEDPLCP